MNRMNPGSKLVAVGATLVLSCGATASAAGQQRSAGDFKLSHPREITNAFLPLAWLKKDVLVGTEGGKTVRIERVARPERHRTFTIGKQKFDSLAVEDREFEGDGELTEVTLDYFAQADDGTVLYLGEEVDEYKHGKVVGHEGAWMLGKDTRTPGVILPGHPKVGDKFRSEDVSKQIREDDEVLSLSETVTVPAGTFHNCLKLKEVLADGTIEYKYYAPGVGVVREIPADGAVDLKSHETNATAQAASPQPVSAQPGGEKVFQDPLSREALALVGLDPDAEDYWFLAIQDATLPKSERQDLIDDLNEDGLPDPKHPTLDDLPLILARIEILEDLVPTLPNELEWQEPYDDLMNLAELAVGRGKPVH